MTKEIENVKFDKELVKYDKDLIKYESDMIPYTKYKEEYDRHYGALRIKELKEVIKQAEKEIQILKK